ncbi:MAG: hypothetical protein JNM00_10310, partial [Flavobacteriales bacterium]|nr:hypothetical protein [Flavobacteriales bacterium]
MEQKNNFLDQVAAHLLATHRQRFRDLVVVVPGRRSGAHLKLKLARMADTPVWMPRIVSIGDLHTFLSGKKTAIRPHLLLGLYECHVNAHGQLADGFEAFLNYAPTVLADFSEADSYLVNTRKLYGDLRSIKEIEAWSLNDPQLTPEQESYVRFWRRMGELNDTFDQWQEQTGNLTRGKLAKTTALQIETLVRRWHNQYFVYAGTHALHAADQHILNFLVERGMAEVLRDTDEYYLSIDQHEAAYHLRKEPDNGLWKGDYYREIPKTITIHRCGTGITTSAVAAQLLQTSDEGTRAVVLTGDPDFDVLRHAIPPDGPSLRYSGTTRLGETPVFTWLLLWCRLMQENPAGKLRIHHKTFIDWLSEETCTGINRALSGEVSRYIIRQN